MIHDVQVINVSKYVSPFLQQSYYLNWQVVTEVSIIQILVLIQTDYKHCNAVPVLCTHRNFIEILFISKLFRSTDQFSQIDF